MINYDTLLDNLKDLDLFNDDVSYGTERLMYGPFYKKYFNFRNAHISNKFTPIPNDIQLPAGSCVHILNNLYNEERGLLTSDLPDLSYPFIKNENYRKFIYHVKEPNVKNPDSIIQFPEIRYIYRSINLDLTLRKFRTENENTYRQLQSLSQIPQTPTTLTIINHNPLFRVRVRELLPQYKRFLVIFGSILNIAATIEKKVQYIFIPLGNRVYLKNMFAMAEKEIKPTSIKAKNDFHYFVMMHWLNFLNPFSDQSIILKYPKEKWSTTVFVFYYGDYYMFWTLEDIVNLNQKNLAYNRIINQYNSLVITGMGGEIPDAVTEEEIHETVQELKEENTPIQIEGTPDKQEIEKKKEEEQKEKENKEKEALNISRIISSIADKTKSIINIKEDDLSLPPLQYKGVKKISKAQKNIVPDIDDVDLDDELTPEEISSHIDDYAPIESVDDTSSIENTFIGNSISNKYISGDLSHITPITDKKSISQLGVSYMEDIDNGALALIEQQEKLTLKQKERLLRVAQAYKNLTIGDETLESIISEEKDVNVSENKVDNLDNYLVDKSMENSSIQTFDTDYMQKLYKKHIAEVATSFTKNGMFLVGVEENFSTDELNRLVKYKFTYEDIKGKRHTVKFTLPFVGDDGSCYVNGTKQYFRTQMSDLPICKVSPVRVSLASYYNKTIVERNVNKAHSFIAYLQKLISKVNLQQPNTILLDYGISKDTDIKLPYEYAEISNIYKSIVITDSTNSSKYNFNFIYKNRFKETNDSVTSYLTNIESKLNAVYLGIKQNSNESSYYCFITQNNIIKIIDEKENVQLSTTFIDLLYSIFPAIIQPTSRLTEWTNIKILDKKFPVIFLLAYRFGLEHVLQYLGSQYILIDRPARLSNMHIRSSDIIITFKNKYLIIPRYPIRNSLILAGLDFFDTKDMNFEEFNSTDVYYQLLINKNFKINYLKGIDDTFDHFVDPITREVLIQMNEPTTFKDLLIRATDMVSNNYHLEASSVHNHRYRSYERFAGTLYNEMARQFNSFTKKKSAGATFSLNPNAIFLRIIQDQSMLQMDDINPMHDIKTKASVTYTGIGGRSGESFVVNDRRYPRDGMGVLSPDTADSGNVAINAGTPMDPTVTNLYGFFKQVDPKELKPTNLLSASDLVMPGVTQDDSEYVFIH